MKMKKMMVPGAVTRNHHRRLVNFPSKFISADGRTLWLSYSANFTNGYLNTRFKSSPEGSRYAMCLQEVKLGTQYQFPN